MIWGYECSEMNIEVDGDKYMDNEGRARGESNRILQKISKLDKRGIYLSEVKIFLYEFITSPGKYETFQKVEV